MQSQIVTETALAVGLDALSEEEEEEADDIDIPSLYPFDPNTEQVW